MNTASNPASISSSMVIVLPTITLVGYLRPASSDLNLFLDQRFGQSEFGYAVYQNPPGSWKASKSLLRTRVWSDRRRPMARRAPLITATFRPLGCISHSLQFRVLCIIGRKPLAVQWLPVRPFPSTHFARIVFPVGKPARTLAGRLLV